MPEAFLCFINTYIEIIVAIDISYHRNYASSESDSSDQSTSNPSTPPAKRKKLSAPSSGESGQTCDTAMMLYANQYLKPYYDKDPVARDDKLFIVPCDKFINLALVQKDKTVSKDHALLKAGRMDRNLETNSGNLDTNSGTTLSLNDIIAGTKFVLVEGPPGFGKSTLSWELCRKWDALSSLENYKIILLLKLREKRVQNATCLSELLSFCCVDASLCEKVKNEVLECTGKGILLLLDGLDEMPSSVVEDDNKLITKVIDRSCLPCATRVVTSRPSALHLTRKFFPSDFRHIEILSFTDECKEEFAKIAFNSEPDMLAHFKDFMVVNPVINSLMCIPINCAIIAQVYKDIMKIEDKMPRTTTELYTTLTKVLIRRHMISIKKCDEDSSVFPDLKFLPEYILKDFERISKLAYKSLFQKNVQLEFSKSEVGEEFDHLGLMNEAKKTNMSEGTTTFYSFLHLSMQEFLAAWFVVHHNFIDEIIPKMFNYWHVLARFEVFGQFLAGMVGYNSDFFSKVSKSEANNRSPYLLRCLYEIPNISKSRLDIEVPYALHPNNPMDMYFLGYCLVHVPIKHLSLSIRTSLEMLVLSLSDHMKKSNIILGTIEHLHVEVLYSKHELSKLESFTKYLHRFSIESLALGKICTPLVPVCAEWISALQGLTAIALNFFESCEDDYLLYQSIQHNVANLNQFEVDCCTPTQKGAEELTKIITSSSSLKRLKLRCFPSLLCDTTKKFKLSELFASFELYPALKAALSSSSISRLYTNFGYRIFINAQNIERVSLELSLTWSASSSYIHPLEMLRSLQYISSIAENSPIKSIFLVRTEFNLVRAIPNFCNFIVLLNHSLFRYQSMEKLFFQSDEIGCHDSHFDLSAHPFYKNSVARTLRKDPIALKHDLRRSQSLCDLRTLHSHHQHISYRSLKENSLPKWRHISYSWQNPNKLGFYQSCPNLLEMQSLHNMHPVLQKALKYNALLYNQNSNENIHHWFYIANKMKNFN